MTEARGAPARTRRPLTGRALILGAVLVLLVVLLAAPLHRFLAARSAVQQSVTQRDAGQQQLKQLEQLNKQLNDPAYIEALARARLQYALPGDTVYVVVQAGQKPTIDASTAKSTVVSKVPGGTWNRRLWGSIQSADHSP
jgi:cell division protein FtsB